MRNLYAFLLVLFLCLFASDAYAACTGTITSCTAATVLGGNDVVQCRQSGDTADKKCSATIFKTFILGGGSAAIASGKTLTISNSFTATATDGSTVAFGTGGTVLYSGGAGGTPSSITLTNGTGLPLTGLASQATNTIVGNATSGSASPTALAISSCSTAGSALQWTTDTGFGCNTSITAAAAPVSGLTGAGTGVLTFLGTPSSANLKSAITDETGSGGALVFATGPAVTGITTDTLGATSVITDTQSINATSTDGLVLTNTTAAAAGAQQWSPRLRLHGNGWKTNATASSQTVDLIQELVPIQGAANPAYDFAIRGSVNGAAYADLIRFHSASSLDIVGGGVSNTYFFIGTSDLASGHGSTGAENVGIGKGAFANSLGASDANNTAVGAYAGYQASGNRNTVLGAEALYSGGGSDNTSIGYNAAHNLTTGGNTVAVGSGACNVASAANSTCIGKDAAPTTGLTNTTSVGYQAAAANSNSVYLGNSSVTAEYVGNVKTFGISGGVASLNNGVIATTQSASDNSTKVATTAYVDNQVNIRSQTLAFAISDQTTTITAANGVYDQYPFESAITITGVHADCKTAPTGTMTIDVNEAGTTILSTKLTIDANENSSGTAAAAAVISDASFAANARLSVDIDSTTGGVGCQVIITYHN